MRVLRPNTGRTQTGAVLLLDQAIPVLCIDHLISFLVKQTKKAGAQIKQHEAVRKRSDSVWSAKYTSVSRTHKGFRVNARINTLARLLRDIYQTLHFISGVT